MSKYSGTICDICGRDITGTEQLRLKSFRFFGWHYRTGYHHTFHMCLDCKCDFATYVSEKRSEK